MNKFFFVLFLLITPSVLSQTAPENKPDKDFENFLYHILITANNNPTQALYLADSAYIHSSSQRKKSRALMLSATILERENREIEGIHQAIKALQITQRMKDHSFEARIYGYLATQNRNIGFYDEGEHYLNQGIKTISKIEDKNQVERYIAMANHEMSEIAFEKEDYPKALNYIDQAILSYKKEPSEQQRWFILATAHQLRGRILAEVNKPNEAMTCFKEAVYLIKKAGADKSLHAALIYQSIGDLFLKEKARDSAGIYLIKAMEISESSDNELTKEAVFGSLTEYYREIGDSERLDFFQNKYYTILKTNQHKKKQKINNLHILLKENRELEQKSKLPTVWKTYTGSTIVLIALSGLGLFLMQRKKQNRNIAEETEVGESEEKPKELKISTETELQIVRNLKIFEQSRQYLHPDISFPKMTTSLQTNAKYLNHYLKTHLQKDYTTYINDLRINYIITRLENNKAYRNYKISYLAKESGFSSHSTFSANFKRVTGFSPSEYIEGLKNE